MAGNQGKPKKSASRGKSGRGKGAGARWPIVLALALPAVLVGGFLAYHASPWFAGQVDGAAGRVRGWVSGVPGIGESGRASDPGVAEPHTGPGPSEPVFREPMGPAMDQPLPDEPLVEPSPPRPVEESRKPKEAGKVLPRQERRPVVSSGIPVSTRQAQKLVAALFGGKVTSATSARKEPWYTIELAGGRKRYPYDVAPRKVLVSTTALSGAFLKDGAGFVMLFRVEDPAGAEWTSCFVGATLFKGTPQVPGAIVGSTAMQAPKGRIVRQEAIDTQGDGVAELVLEIESEGPQGALFRDLGVHSFSSGGTVGRWTVRTLDDAPGLPAETASFRNVKFKDRDGDGKLEIEVETGRRSFKVKDDMSREPAGEKIVSRTSYRLEKGRYVVAKKQ